MSVCKPESWHLGLPDNRQWTRHKWQRGCSGRWEYSCRNWTWTQFFYEDESNDHLGSFEVKDGEKNTQDDDGTDAYDEGIDDNDTDEDDDGTDEYDCSDDGNGKPVDEGNGREVSPEKEAEAGAGEQGGAKEEAVKKVTEDQ